MIHVLRPSKYKNSCELCDKIIYKGKKVILTVNKSFVIHEEVIYVFHEKYDIPTIGKLSFHLDHVRIIGSMEFARTRNDCFQANA